MFEEYLDGIRKKEGYASQSHMTRKYFIQELRQSVYKNKPLISSEERFLEDLDKLRDLYYTMNSDDIALIHHITKKY